MEGSGRRPPQGRPSHPQPTCMDVIVSEPFRTPRETASPRPSLPVIFYRKPAGRFEASPARPLAVPPDPDLTKPRAVLPTSSPPDDDMLLRITSGRGLPRQQGQLARRQRRARTVQRRHPVPPSPAPGRLQARGVQSPAHALAPDANIRRICISRWGGRHHGGIERRRRRRAGVLVAR